MSAAPRVSALYVYPVKSCGGIALERVELDARGPVHDRRWMIVDERDRFVTQRELPPLALVRVTILGPDLVLRAPGRGEVRVPLAGAPGEQRRVVCWRDPCDAVDQGEAAARWLGDALGRPLRLVRMADDCERVVNPARSPERAVTGFTDGYPVLLLGEASRADLERRCGVALPMDRFRPNVVVGGSEPYAEDGWRRLRIGRIPFDVVKPCSRCAITTTDQSTGDRGREPLATLARYRRRDHEVWFGQNAVHRAPGEIAVGDPVEVLETGPAQEFD